jgi:hypothetical protein
MAKAYIKNNELIYVSPWVISRDTVRTVNKELIDELEKNDNDKANQLY